MKEKTSLDSEFNKELKHTRDMTNSFVAALQFIMGNSSRDPLFTTNYPLAYLGFDLLQSSLAIPFLANEGLLSVCKRELRFLLEASIKLAFVQTNFSTSIEDKLIKFQKELQSTNIGIKKLVPLKLLQPSSVPRLLELTGRLYGETSGYVHLGPKQINERIASVRKGRSPGMEGIDDQRTLNRLVFQVYCVTLVFLLHSVPEFVVGDFMVEDDGSTVQWLFMKSEFMAEIDSNFDYKHERKSRLEEIQKLRRAMVSNSY